MCCAVHTLCFVVYGFKACGHTLVPNPPQQQRMQAQLSFETLLTYTDDVIDRLNNTHQHV